MHAVNCCKHWYLSRRLAPVIYHILHAQYHNVSTECILVATTLLHCGLATTPATGVIRQGPAPGVHTTNTKLFSGYGLKQHIAYCIGQMECLKSLLSEGNTQYGLGALHRGNYTTDITRFSLRQRIAFLMGQVQCLKVYLVSQYLHSAIPDFL